MTSPRPEPARYTAGDTYAIATPHGVAIVAPGVDDAVVEDVWRALAAGEGLAAVLDAAAGTRGFADMPPFGLVMRDEPARVLVRGDVEAHVTDAAGRTCVLSGAGVATWAEHVVADAHAVSLRLGAAPAGAGLPVVDGIVRAGAVTVMLSADAASPAIAAPATGAQHVVPDAAEAESPKQPAEAPESAEAPRSAEAPQPAEAPEPAEAVPTLADQLVASVPAWVSGDASAARAAVVPEQADNDEAAAAAAPATAPAAAPATAAVRVPDPDPLDTVQSDRRGRFAHLWGETVMASVAAAAVADAEPSTDDVAGAPSPEPLVRAGDHDGATVSLAAARAMRAAGRTELPPVPAPPSPQQGVLGRLELSTGRTVLLDRDVVIGRRPRATRVGDAAPQLVTVDSPGQDISRSHIEVRLEGESAVVVDLDTTNGTVLHREGSSPMRLHPGEATMLLDGDVLDLGDEVTVAYRES
ncbi:FHA domain-containing protein [Microbacterium sp. Sa4CUA7]|uniref:FHA domain-containing protein n=1 Tax=Microbacterium pullorum TaxID=2762236 RepID=A0ABR8S4B7_9MICO|nr:FHA domain-containing protein [Microbacterium pullorum]MBD7958337.1 FHA domain-containing protein [Microbacterium pullorum]